MIRELDRKLCLQHYPMLLLPEMYVMKGGYSQFYGQFPVSESNGVRIYVREATRQCKKEYLVIAETR